LPIHKYRVARRSFPRLVELNVTRTNGTQIWANSSQ
jgi:hypothetical protein